MSYLTEILDSAQEGILLISTLRLPLFVGKWRKVCVFSGCTGRRTKTTATVLQVTAESQKSLLQNPTRFSSLRDSLDEDGNLVKSGRIRFNLDQIRTSKSFFLKCQLYVLELMLIENDARRFVT